MMILAEYAHEIISPELGMRFLLIYPYFISLSLSLNDTLVVASGMKQKPWSVQG